MIAAALLLLLLLAPEGKRVPIPIDPVPPAPSRIDILDRCAAGGEGSDITVCGNRGPSPYRVDGAGGFDPNGDAPSVAAERNALLGPNAPGGPDCSPTGAFGWQGCQVQQWRREALQGTRRK